MKQNLLNANRPLLDVSQAMAASFMKLLEIGDLPALRDLQIALENCDKEQFPNKDLTLSYVEALIHLNFVIICTEMDLGYNVMPNMRIDHLYREGMCLLVDACENKLREAE